MYINLSTLKISNCVGCFGCWTKMPSKCVIRDDTVKVFSILFTLIHPILERMCFGTIARMWKSAFYYFACIFLIIPYHTVSPLDTYFKNSEKDKRKQNVLSAKINLVYKNFTRCLSNIQNMSLHNYVVTDIKKVSTKNFQLFPHSFPQQNIGNVLFFSVFNMSF